MKNNFVSLLMVTLCHAVSANTALSSIRQCKARNATFLSTGIACRHTNEDYWNRDNASLEGHRAFQIYNSKACTSRHYWIGEKCSPVLISAPGHIKVKSISLECALNEQAEEGTAEQSVVCGMDLVTSKVVKAGNGEGEFERTIVFRLMTRSWWWQQGAPGLADLITIVFCLSFLMPYFIIFALENVYTLNKVSFIIYGLVLFIVGFVVSGSSLIFSKGLAPVQHSH